jgi:hypothetical protein
MTFIKLYNFKPNIGDYVNFIFTEHKDDYLCCKLVEYDLDCIMTFKCLTSKKKIKSIKSLAPLNKEMIGIIENIYSDNIELNKINVNINSDDYKIFTENNQSNHVLKKYINQYIHKYDKDINFILEKYIYTLDHTCNYLEQIINSDMNIDLYTFIKNNFKSSEKKSNELKLKISCYGDINNLIKLFDETKQDTDQDNNKDINIIQSNLSEYIVSSNYNIDNFIILLKNNILKYNDIMLHM